MKIHEILNSDLSSSKDKKELQLWLKKIKPISKKNYSGDVPLEVIEKMLNKLRDNGLHWHHIFVEENGKQGVKYTVNTTTLGKRFETRSKGIEAFTIYDALAKLLIYAWAIYKKRNK